MTSKHEQIAEKLYLLEFPKTEQQQRTTTRNQERCERME